MSVIQRSQSRNRDDKYGETDDLTVGNFNAMMDTLTMHPKKFSDIDEEPLHETTDGLFSGKEFTGGIEITGASPGEQKKREYRDRKRGEEHEVTKDKKEAGEQEGANKAKEHIQFAGVEVKHVAENTGERVKEEDGQTQEQLQKKGQLVNCGVESAKQQQQEGNEPTGQDMKEETQDKNGEESSESSTEEAQAQAQAQAGSTGEHSIPATREKIKHMLKTVKKGVAGFLGPLDDKGKPKKQH